MSNLSAEEAQAFDEIKKHIENIALNLRPDELPGEVAVRRLSAAMRRRIISLGNVNSSMDDTALNRICVPLRNLAERTINELTIIYQDQQLLCARLWEAFRDKECLFIGPDLQEKVLKCIMVLMEDGSAFSRTDLESLVVDQLDADFPFVNSLSVERVVQLLHGASCFRVWSRDGNRTLIQLRENFRNYTSMRRAHDTYIFRLAYDSGMRIAPIEWSVLLYGDLAHILQMESVNYNLDRPRLLAGFLQELQLALTNHEGLPIVNQISTNLAPIAALDRINEGTEKMTWQTLNTVLNALDQLVSTLHDLPPVLLSLQDLPKNGDDVLRYLAQRLSRQRNDNVFDIDFDAYHEQESQQEQLDQQNLEEQFHPDVQEHLHEMAPQFPYVNGNEQNGEEDNAVGYNHEELVNDDVCNLRFLREHHRLLMPRLGVVPPRPVSLASNRYGERPEDMPHQSVPEHLLHHIFSPMANGPNIFGFALPSAYVSHENINFGQEVGNIAGQPIHVRLQEQGLNLDPAAPDAFPNALPNGFPVPHRLNNGHGNATPPPAPQQEEAGAAWQRPNNQAFNFDALEDAVAGVGVNPNPNAMQVLMRLRPGNDRVRSRNRNPAPAQAPNNGRDPNVGNGHDDTE